MKRFDKSNRRLTAQFENVRWIEDSGLDASALHKEYEQILQATEGMPCALQKAKIFEMILQRGRIAVDPDDIFQDKLLGAGILSEHRQSRQNAVVEAHLREEQARAGLAYQCGLYQISSDFGHTSPNSKLLLEVGFVGLLDRVSLLAAREGLTERQRQFYESCRITLSAVLHFIRRMADAVRPHDAANAAALDALAVGAPNDLYEAMQLLIVYFFLHEYIGATRVRTLGRIDVLLCPFYRRDIERGRYTKTDAKEMIKFFLNKFWTAKVPYDLPLCLGGMGEDGTDVTNEFTYLFVETYNEMDIHSPKIHIRVSEQTPRAFVTLVLRCIRDGNSSFVFMNDDAVTEGLSRVGIESHDAVNYVPIGCYEPAVWGKEIGCTGNGGVNLAKAVELVLTDGTDHKSGVRLTPAPPPIRTFEDFFAAVKAQLRHAIGEALHYVRAIEPYYGEIGPDPLLSAMYDHSAEVGLDVYEGGARYNNSSLSLYFLASATDSICAVKRLVFEDRLVDLPTLVEILKSDWQGHEKLRRIAERLPEKYGNNDPTADAIAAELAHECAACTNGQPNGRGGVFKAAIFSIDHFVNYGKKTMATPNGRHTGAPLSKNLCATVGCDTNGVTALIGSATKFKHSDFPNGAVLDLILHPSAVMGEDGLSCFYALLKTYMSRGGMALHGNVFCTEELRAAQKEPEKYRHLQVRVCGWNAYFVNLSKTEQDCFIEQASTTYV